MLGFIVYYYNVLVMHFFYVHLLIEITTWDSGTIKS